MMTTPAPSRPFARFLAPAEAAGAPLLLTLAAIVTLFAATQVLGAIAAATVDDLTLALRPFANADARSRAILILTLGVIGGDWIILAILLPAAHHRALSTVLGPSARRFFRGALAGGAAAALGVLALAAPLTFEPGALSWSPPPAALWWAWVAVALLIVAQASAEELVFRGYLIQQLAVAARSPVIWAVAPALLFGFLHFAPRPADDPAAQPDALAYAAAATLFALVMTFLVWRTGSLGAAIGAHVVVNWTAILLVDQTNEPLGVLALFAAQRADPIELLLSQAVFLLVIIAAFEAPFSPIRRFLRLAPLYRRSS